MYNCVPFGVNVMPSQLADISEYKNGQNSGNFKYTELKFGVLVAESVGQLMSLHQLKTKY